VNSGGIDLGANQKKRDRTARMLKIQILLGQNPHGMTIDEIAAACDINPRTVYRDLEAIESVLNVPIWQQGKKRGIVEGYHLPPIPFNLAEAMNIFLAIRLMQKNIGWYDPNIATTFKKLSSVVPPNIAKQIQNTINWMEKLPRNPRQLNIAENIAKAWVTQHKVTIWYQNDRSHDKSQPLVIEPYFIETTAGQSSFVIAQNSRDQSIGSYKLSQIQDIKVESETYTIPESFNVLEYLGTK
jgi:predicted DNA-binding transcriptional regulator YafY